MHDPAQKLNVGLIVDSAFATKYTYEIAEWAQKQSNIQVSHLIIQDASQVRLSRAEKAIRTIRNGNYSQLMSQVLFVGLTKMENILLKLDPHHQDHFQRHDLSKIVSGSVRIRPQISKSGHVFRYADDDVEKIRALNLDVLIRYGSGILNGQILQAAKYGILSFHHADNAINRGGPAGFWEVLLRQDATGFIIQQLTEELDGGNILVSGKFPTKSHYLLNQATVCKKSNFYMKKLLSDIAETRSLPAPKKPAPYSSTLFRRPKPALQAAYACQLLSRLGKKYLSRRILKHRYEWGVAFARGDWRDLVMWRATRLENPPGRSLATPFAIREDGKDYLFVEDFDFATGKACISVYGIDGNKASRLGEALSEPFHLSFPYLFRHQGKLYMCPETSEAGEIRLYECVEFPLRWKLCKVLIENVSAVGTMIFEKDGRWWLFTNIDPAQTDDNGSELFIFHADNPLSDNWTPHAANPCIVDSSRARNGGLLVHEGNIHRIGQRQGFDVYGKGFSINRIDVLNSQTYLETDVCNVTPDFYPGIRGTHHMHGDGDLVVFDYLRLGKPKAGS